MKTLELIWEDLERHEIYSNKKKISKTPIAIFLILADSGVRSLTLYRIRHALYKKNKGLLYFFKILTAIFSPIQIYDDAKIGGGCCITHALGIVIGTCEIGKNSIFYQGVTIGLKNKTGECPVIGDYVHIGAGAKILGDITIGSNSIIGANAVVITDIPENSLAVGIPATIKKNLN